MRAESSEAADFDIFVWKLDLNFFPPSNDVTVGVERKLRLQKIRIIYLYGFVAVADCNFFTVSLKLSISNLLVPRILIRKIFCITLWISLLAVWPSFQAMCIYFLPLESMYLVGMTNNKAPIKNVLIVSKFVDKRNTEYTTTCINPLSTPVSAPVNSPAFQGQLQTRSKISIAALRDAVQRTSPPEMSKHEGFLRAGAESEHIPPSKPPRYGSNRPALTERKTV